jgi:hypothetical protein
MSSVRKGQYMAIEAVLSLGLSLIVAVAAIGVFNNYRGSVFDAIGDRNVEITSSRVVSAMYNLGHMGEGSSITVEVPQTGSRTYDIAVTADNLEISSGSSSYTYSLDSITWTSNIEGSAQGDEIALVRVNNGVEVRSD